MSIGAKQLAIFAWHPSPFQPRNIALSTPSVPMGLILDGSSEQNEHLWIETGYLIKVFSVIVSRTSSRLI